MSDQTPFDDLVTGERCVLHMTGMIDPIRPGWTVGVEHLRCDKLADVYPDMDCFYCSACGWNGRVSGVAVLTLWDQHLDRLERTKGQR